MSPDIAASIRARLLRKAKESGDEFEFTLVRYACERFLYRLGASPLRERCILKGASLQSVWMDDPYRATRDVDLLSRGSSDEAAIRDIVSTICSVPCPEDGLTFDLDTLTVTSIRADQEYDGQRAVLTAYLASARIRLQVDFGFGDVLSLDPIDTDYPTLIIGTPVPRLRVYRRETAVAEKLEAIVRFGRRNSRMKDFHDVWAISSTFEFDGLHLCEAVGVCFDRRRTRLTAELPDVLTPAFYSDPDLQARWSAYIREGAFKAAPPFGFDIIGERIRAFFGPIRDRILGDSEVRLSWSRDGGWVMSPILANTP